MKAALLLMMALQPCADQKGLKEAGAGLREALQLHKAWVEGLSGTGRRADLTDADLSRLALQRQDLSGALLKGANLAYADLRGSSLRSANLLRADLRCSLLAGADLSLAVLTGASLQNAGLSRADLRAADLNYAGLRGADLKDALLEKARLRRADLSEALFEPLTLPGAREIAQARGLASLRFSQPAALEQLRARLRQAGFRDQERQVTYSLHRVRRISSLSDLAQYLLFEAACLWGLAPLRPLGILAGQSALFTLLYALALLLRGPKPERGIFRDWGGGRAIEFLHRGNCSPLASGLYFSALSTFYFGWDENRRSHPLARFNPREYELKAVGWLRTAAGLQSILSLYLIVLFLLAQFGRPFG